MAHYHECWRFSSPGSTATFNFTCSCGCCGTDYDRYCCNTSFCFDGGIGSYINEPATIGLLCLVSIVLVGMMVVLILVCYKPKQTSGFFSTDDESAMFPSNKPHTNGQTTDKRAYSDSSEKHRHRGLRGGNPWQNRSCMTGDEKQRGRNSDHRSTRSSSSGGSQDPKYYVYPDFPPPQRIQLEQQKTATC